MKNATNKTKTVFRNGPVVFKPHSGFFRPLASQRLLPSSVHVIHTATREERSPALEHRAVGGGVSRERVSSPAGHDTCVEVLLEQEIFQKTEGNTFSPLHCAV